MESTDRVVLQVLMHPRLGSVHWDAKLNVCEVSVSVAGSQSEVRVFG